MKLRLGAAVLAAALTPLTVVTAPSPALAGVDTTPPEVGSCHHLTYDEYYGSSEPEPPVECSATHTSVTLRVTELDPVANWNEEWPRIVTREYVPCLKDLVQATGGSAARVQLSAYHLTFFRPTKAQRDAGAAWVRCDAVLVGGVKAIAPLPESIVIDGTRPPSDVRKCYRGKRQDFAETVCTRRHQYIATYTFLMRDNGYPGERAARRFSYRKCHHKLGDRNPWVYEWVANRFQWRAGLRHAVCAPAD